VDRTGSGLCEEAGCAERTGPATSVNLAHNSQALSILTASTKSLHWALFRSSSTQHHIHFNFIVPFTSYTLRSVHLAVGYMAVSN